jgi:hypothetical protein
MSLFQEGYKLYYGQMMAQLPINKEVCTFLNFPLFCPNRETEKGRKVDRLQEKSEGKMKKEKRNSKFPPPLF